jgi:hypothetical protein
MQAVQQRRAARGYRISPPMNTAAGLVLRWPKSSRAMVKMKLSAFAHAR